jgi:Na+/H+ antiporter NhaA/predicted DsbA family dithiol-disulfide isomerase
MAVPVGIYLAINAGHGSTHGWGTAMSTDTAFALGVLTLVGPRLSGRLRAFMLTVVVVDDVVALLVIAVVFTSGVSGVALGVAAAILAAVLVFRYLGIRRGLLYAVLGAAMWVAVLKSGVDPVIVGLVMGLLTYAYPAARVDLERATDLFRLFREQPTPELARSARVGLEYAISPNERLQHLYHPWSSYVIVPLFALGNAGIPIDGTFLTRAFTSPITLGILVAYVAGKPAGILGASLLATRLSRGKLRLPVGWAALAGGGAIAGIGFTVSLLIASLAFNGNQLQEAKLGVLSAAVCASLLSWLVFRGIERLPRSLRVRGFVGPAEAIVDLAAEVDAGRDHIRGPADAPVTLVEYGDFECPYCGQAEEVIRELLADFGDVRYVWRHLPLTDVHGHAQLAAEAAEAAAEQGAFWEMHDLLFRHQDALRRSDLERYARELELDVERFDDALRTHRNAARVADDVDSADLSGVSGTPTFFVNGRRHYGAYDIATLTDAVRSARARAAIAA